MLNIDRRSAARKGHYEESPGTDGTNQIPTITAAEDPSPLPFVWKDDHIPFRHQFVQRQCNYTLDQYILFLIDTSGSIGNETFHQFTEALSNITTYFCKTVRVAVMTFSHDFYLEFCFDSHDTLTDVSEAIKDIEYHRGNTHTGGAVQCACRELLNERCGLPESTECLDIVLITDGQSNDPHLEICEEIQCLHNRSLNTYVMGIGDVNDDELQCIQKSDNEISIFKFVSYDEVIEVFNDAVGMLKSKQAKIEKRTCFNSGAILKK